MVAFFIPDARTDSGRRHPNPSIKHFLLTVVGMLLLFSPATYGERNEGNSEKMDYDNIYLKAVDDHLEKYLRPGAAVNFGSNAREADIYLGFAGWAYGSRLSRWYQDPRLLPPFVRAVDALFMGLDASEKGKSRSPDMIYRDPPVVEVDLERSCHGALLGFIAAIKNPEIAAALGDQRMAAIHASMKKSADFWLAQEKSRNHEQPWFYAMAIVNLTYGYLYTGDPAYLRRISHWFGEIYKSRSASGGLGYMRDNPYFGPVYWYSDATLFELGFARMALEGLPEATPVIQEMEELARATSDAFREVLVSPGYQEYYSVIWWKQLKRTRTEPFATATLALLSKDPTMVYMASRGAERGYFYDGRPDTMRTLVAAQYMEWIKDYPEAEPDDHYSFYDKDRIGIRGRFGPFNYTAQAGAFAGTVVGVTMLDENRGLNAILQRVTPVVRINPDPDASREDLNGLWIQSWSPREGYDGTVPPVSVARMGDYGAVGTRYHPLKSHWGSEEAVRSVVDLGRHWEMVQLWITGPERLVGLIITTCLQETNAAGVALWMSVSENEIKPTDDPNIYAAGKLRVSLIGHDYSKVGMAPSRAWVARDREKEWSGLYLADEAGAVHYIEEKKSPVVAYHPGDSWWALIDIYPEISGPSEAEVIAGDGWIALRSLQGEGELTALMNLTAEDMVVSIDDLGLPENGTYQMARGAHGNFVQPIGAEIRLTSNEVVIFVNKNK